VLEEVAVDVNPYGAAIDANGWIWASGMRPRPGYIQRFHTVSLAVDPPIDLTGTGCDSPTDSIYSPYGIAVDTDLRVWVGSWSPNVCRYDPSDGSFLTVTLDLALARGVAADCDASGCTIWASNYTEPGGNRLVSFDADTGGGIVAWDLGGVRPIGVGVDELGQIWAVNQASGTATRLDKATGTLYDTPVGSGPYTYSDFTGYQRSLMMPSGHWQHVFERCDDEPADHWGDLTWDADVPAGAQITIHGFSADAPDDTYSAPSVTLAEDPSDVGPIDIEAAFSDAGTYLGAFLRVLVVLEPSPASESPVFRSIHVRWHCSELG